MAARRLALQPVLCVEGLHRKLLFVSPSFWLELTFSIYQSCINLLFGYSRRTHQRQDSADPSSAPNQGTDLLTSLLSRLAVLLNMEIDVASWSRMIGLVLIGGILLANIRNVLGSVSRVRTRCTSSCDWG